LTWVCGKNDFYRSGISIKLFQKEFIMIRHRLSNLHSRGEHAFYIALCCALFPISIMAEDFTAANTAGSKALLFSFSGLATLGADAYSVAGIGAGIGGKYYLTDPLALRASLIFVTASQKVPAQSGGTDGSKSGTKFGLTAGAEYHLMKGRVSPFVGGTLGFSTTSTSFKNAVPASGTQTTVENDNQTIGGIPFAPGFDFQLAGIGGVEFFLTHNISLSAEYLLGLFLNSPYDTKSTTPPNTTTQKNGTTSIIGIRGAGTLTLSVYF
jgi:opacity protein-like surface antigen